MSERVTEEELITYRSEIEATFFIPAPTYRDVMKKLLDEIDLLRNEKLRSEPRQESRDFEVRIRELESEVELLQSSVKLLIINGARNEKGNGQ